MSDKYTTPGKILSTHYITHSANRKTTNAEFNADAEYMIGIKQMYYTSQQRAREARFYLSEGAHYYLLRKKFADMVFEYCKEQSQLLQAKNWGTTKIK